MKRAFFVFLRGTEVTLAAGGEIFSKKAGSLKPASPRPTFLSKKYREIFVCFIRITFLGNIIQPGPSSPRLIIKMKETAASAVYNNEGRMKGLIQKKAKTFGGFVK